MYTIKIHGYPHQENESFMIVRPFKPHYKQGEKYLFQNKFNNHFAGTRYLASLKMIRLSELTSMHGYMDRNCELSLYKEILLSNHPELNYESYVCVMVFTEIKNVRKLHKMEHTSLDFGKDRKTNLKAYNLPKTYVHKSDKDYANSLNQHD